VAGSAGAGATGECVAFFVVLGDQFNLLLDERVFVDEEGLFAAAGSLQ
jgi:hypothetical protein